MISDEMLKLTKGCMFYIPLVTRILSQLFGYKYTIELLTSSS